MRVKNKNFYSVNLSCSQFYNYIYTSFYCLFFALFVPRSFCSHFLDVWHMNHKVQLLFFVKVQLVWVASFADSFRNIITDHLQIAKDGKAAWILIGVPSYSLSHINFINAHTFFILWISREDHLKHWISKISKLTKPGDQPHTTYISRVFAVFLWNYI